MTKNVHIGHRGTIAYKGYPDLQTENVLEPKVNIGMLLRSIPDQCLDALRDAICVEYKITVDQFHSRSRQGTAISRARHLFLYLSSIRMFRDLEQEMIARYIYFDRATNKYYHRTNVVHACKNITNDLQTGALDYVLMTSIVSHTDIKLKVLWQSYLSVGVQVRERTPRVV